MRIPVLGAGGFIGRHILAELTAHGHEVIGVVRGAVGLRDAVPRVRCVERDLATPAAAGDWAEALAGVEVIVNAAGLLRGPAMAAVHVEAPRAVYEAAAAAGVRRVVLISAISARPDVETDYARTKLAGEAVLRASGLEWTILRPSLIYGDGSYGGTSLMRGMAGLPMAIPIPGHGDFAFTPLHAADPARAVWIVCEQERFSGMVVEPVGPDTFTLRDLLSRYRRWLGFGPARFLSVPLPVMRLLGRLGDWTGNGPVATNSLAQMIAGNAGDSAAFQAAIGFAPRSLEAALRDRPAQVQDRWHARLFFLAPAITAILVLLWLASSVLGQLEGAAPTARLVSAVGLSTRWIMPLQVGSSLLDLGIAALLASGRAPAVVTATQVAVVAG